MDETSYASTIDPTKMVRLALRGATSTRQPTHHHCGNDRQKAEQTHVGRHRGAPPSD
jgi:hypothetical protein